MPTCKIKCLNMFFLVINNFVNELYNYFDNIQLLIFMEPVAQTPIETTSLAGEFNYP